MSDVVVKHEVSTKDSPAALRLISTEHRERAFAVDAGASRSDSGLS